jgi:hypothetical protein
MGDVFEGGADLTALPCGAKRGVTSAVQRWIDQYGIPSPADILPAMRLGEVTPSVPFPGPSHITKFVCFGASVINGHTTAEAISNIGRSLGEMTVRNPEIRIVESVLFGTGHGRMPDEPAGLALAKGFKETATKDATLWIWLHGAERHSRLQAAINAGFKKRFFDAINLRPSFFGLSIDLKKLFKR